MFPLTQLERFLGRSVYKPCLILGGIAIITWPFPVGMMQFFYYLSLIALSSLVIWRAGDHFSPAAEFIEAHHNVPQSVKAAVIDAIASSFPEFAVAVIAVIVIGRFEVGVATVAGSALYNVLVIPAASGLVAATPLVLSREVIWRDSLFYLVVVTVLVFFLYQTTEWSIGIASVFFFLYVAYIFLLHQHYKNHQEQTAHTETTEKKKKELRIASEKEAWAWIIGMMLVMGGTSYVLVEASIGMGNLLGFDAVIMSFVVIAAGTSVPDTVLSVLSTKRGNYDAAVSNVFGSNIFDICVCLSVPVAMMFFGGSAYTLIELPQKELLWTLIGATIITIVFFYSNNYTLNQFKSALMLILYVGIVLYALTLA